MAKYQTFEQYKKGEKIIRYLSFFERCWNFATEAAEEKFNSAAKSGPTNSRYITALEVWREFRNGLGFDGTVSEFDRYCEQRLNG